MESPNKDMSTGLCVYVCSLGLGFLHLSSRQGKAIFHTMLRRSTVVPGHSDIADRYQAPCRTPTIIQSALEPTCLADAPAIFLNFWRSDDASDCTGTSGSHY